MQKTRVGVLRGGPSAEYDVSLRTGQTVLQHLPKDRYDVKDILIDKKGEWHLRGMPVAPSRAFDQVDVMFNALHGRYGEDGEVQRMLDAHGVRYTGSKSLGSALAMHKGLSRTCLRHAPFKHVTHRVLTKDDVGSATILETFRSLPLPVIVKPAQGGSSLGITIVQSFDALLYALLEAFSYTDSVLIERYIQGREVTVTVVEGFRGEKLYTFPPVEVTAKENGYFGHREKYEGGARRICPAPFPHEVTRKLLDAGRYVHTTLGLRHYSQADFIVSRDGIYFLEVNSLPGLTPTSLIPTSLEAVGETFPRFLTHVVERAMAS